MTEPSMVRPRPSSVTSLRGDALVGVAAIARDTAMLGAEATAALLGTGWGMVWRRTGPLRGLVPRQVRVVAGDLLTAAETELRSRIGELAARGDFERRRQTSQLTDLLDRLVPAVVAEMVQRIDITRLVSEHVDIDAIAARVDVDAIIHRLDLAAIADDVLDEIDLPGLIRESSGSLGSAAMVGIRMRSIGADDAVSTFVDRLRRRRRRTDRADPGGEDR